MCDGFALALHAHLNHGLGDAVESVLYRGLKLAITDPVRSGGHGRQKRIADASRRDLRAV